MTAPLLALLLAAPRLLYPVDAPPQVTSTVGTYRIGHHHAGLDLGTDGREGVRALAALDGEIVRIKRSHLGYGRSVVIRHPGGLTTVYAHLERFAPALDALARAEEEKRDAYAFEKTLEPPLPVKQGDFLGYVGTSGTDLIHLHFEVRIDNVPVNPLTHGLALPDSQPPVVSRLLFLPRDGGAQIEGLHAPRELVLGDAAPPPVRLTGRVGLAAEITDHIDGSPRDLEPLRLELRVDGRLAHVVEYERVSYGQKNATELDYLAERRADASGRFHRLFRDPTDGPKLLVWPGPTLDDLGGLSGGPHRLEIVATDAAGHVTERDIAVDIVPFRAPCADGPPPGPAGGASAGALVSRWTESTLIVPLPEACAADFVWGLAASSRGTPFEPSRRFTAVPEGPALAIELDPRRDATVRLETRRTSQPARVQTFEALSVHPGAELTLLGGRVRLSVGRDALFAPYLTDVHEAPNPGAAELLPLGPLAVFRQTWRPARGPSTLRIARPPEAAGPGVALHFHEGERFWRIGGRPVGKAGKTGEAAIEGALVHLGAVGLMRDTTPPTVGEAVFEAHPAGARLVVPLADAGAGLEVDAVRLTVDGRKVHPEYFFAYGRLAWRPWDRLAPGRHVAALSARDAAGNKVSKNLSFQVGP